MFYNTAGSCGHHGCFSADCGRLRFALSPSGSRSIGKVMPEHDGTEIDCTSAEQMLKGHKRGTIFGGREVETKRFDKVSNKMRLQGMKMVSASRQFPIYHSAHCLAALAFVLYAASFPSVMDSLTAGDRITMVFSTRNRADASIKIADKR